MANYVLNDLKMFADITDGIAIVINSETGIYYGMNGFGTVVFEKMLEGASVADILSAIQKLANVPTDIEARLNAFIQDVVEFELVVESAQNSMSVSFEQALADEDDFSLTVSAYEDAQELLLADPIHEVKEDTGWTPEKDSIGYTKEETKEREKKMEE